MPSVTPGEVLLTALMVAGSATVGCSAGDIASEGKTGFARDVFPIVKRGCAVAGCHDSPTQLNHMSDLSTAETTYRRWVNGVGSDFCPDPPPYITVRTIVIPGEPEHSYLVEKISSTREDLCREGHHPRMPPAPRPRLSSPEIGIITSWIREGAEEN
jgi:hypothetical protein